MNKYLANFTLIFLFMIGCLNLFNRLSISTLQFNIIGCGADAGLVTNTFKCTYGAMEISNFLGAIVFVVIGYLIFTKWLQITSIQRLLLAAVLVLVTNYILDSYYFHAVFIPATPPIYGWPGFVTWAKVIASGLIASVVLLTHLSYSSPTKKPKRTKRR